MPKNDKFQFTHFAHKINSFDTAPKKLLASDSRLRPDRYALEHGDLSKAGAEKSRFNLLFPAFPRNLHFYILIHYYVGNSVKFQTFLLSYLFFPWFSLEEKQRAEKKERETKGDHFVPKWFDLTEELAPTPWGELEVYRYNGKYSEHRARINVSDSINLADVKSTEFNPWQYDNLSTE